MCKDNCVHNVKGKMSGDWLPPLRSPSHDLQYHRTNANERRDRMQKELDIQLYMYIIIFTLEHARPTANQTIILAPAGHTESSPESSAARELSRRRVLRCGRFAAGQVRDAAAGGCRQATSQSGSQDVWLFAPVVLSGTGSLSRSWPCRAVATETRAPVRAQAHARTDAVCGTTSARRADDLQFSAGRTNRTALRCLGSPAQYRSSAAASKKTAVSPEPAAISFADRRLVAAYEELRSQAVQGWRRGPGLTLMMARGFRCWMEACSQLFANQGSCTQLPDRPAPSMPSGLRGELVILLASMLLRRASKGIA
jgi:hypothetical protein